MAAITPGSAAASFSTGRITSVRSAGATATTLSKLPPSTLRGRKQRFRCGWLLGVESERQLQPGMRTALALSAIVVATVAWGLIADGAGVGLGTANPPFFLIFDSGFDGAAGVLWLALLLGCAGAAVPLVRGSGSPLAFLVGITLLALGARLALAGVRDGTAGWYSMFGADPEAANEYLPALPALHSLGLHDFLDRFAELAPSLPIHPSAHPPGLLLLTDWLGIDTPEGFAALVIVAGIGAVPLTYFAGRRLELEPWQARAAAAMAAFSPAAMIYGVASADALFATLGIAAVALLVGRGWGSRIAGAVTLAVASFFSWALLAVGAFAVLVVALRDRLAEGIKVAIAAGVAVVIFYVLLYAVSGYEPLRVLHAANEAYDLGISNARPWIYWVFGSPVAFAVLSGLPVAWYAARALGTGHAIAVALVAVIVIASLLGFSKAETERIWLFFGPLLCLAAAAIVPRERMPLVIGLLTAQALLIELGMETVW